MNNHPSALSGTLRRPFTEQVAFFRGKLGRLVPTARWDDISKAAHDRAFMVAGAAKADLLTDLAAAVDRTVTEGKSLGAFRKDFREIVTRNGWHGWTGEETAAGRAWRTRIIYQTNASVSYSAGRSAQLAEGGYPFIVYRHGGSADPRKIHLQWDGLTLPTAHPFWQTNTPPNDWGCSCFAVGARTEAGARRLGGQTSKPLPADWDATVPATGERPGVGKGWGYKPGASVQDFVREQARKVRHWDHRLQKAYMTGVPESQRDALSAAYRALPSVADDTRRYARRIIEQLDDVDVPPVHTMGLATTPHIERIRALRDLDLDGFDWSIDPSVVQHVIRNHSDPITEAQRGQRAITAADYGRLPELLNSEFEVTDPGDTFRSQNPALMISTRTGGEELVTVWEVRRGRRTLALATMFVRMVNR